MVKTERGDEWEPQPQLARICYDDDGSPVWSAEGKDDGEYFFDMLGARMWAVVAGGQIVKFGFV